MNSIENYDVYTTRMSKTFFDKVWFMSNLPSEIDTIVDFGCANGEFLNFLRKNCPSYRYIGIDNDLKFKNLTESNGFDCYESIAEMVKSANLDLNKACLVLSSVIHEIWSYGFAESFKSEISKNKFKCIVIRDMMFNPINPISFYLPMLSFVKINDIFSKSKHCTKWGEMKDVWNKVQSREKIVAHFLLKYMYDENWKREVRENYFPIGINELRNIFLEIGYSIEFQAFYKLPYLVNRWRNDFGLNCNYELNEFVRGINTHYKMLLVV